MKTVPGWRLPVAADGRPIRACAATGKQQAPVRALVAAVVVLAAQVASACPVCYGAPDDPMVKGVSNGVWVLLGLVGFVQIGFVALFWTFWRRGRDLKRFRDSLRVIEGGPKA